MKATSRAMETVEQLAGTLEVALGAACEQQEQLGEALELLERVEWECKGDDGAWYECPFCYEGGWGGTEHLSDCRWLMLMKRAGRR